jgi:hypothetical protein
VAIKRWGYPTTLVLDAAFGCLCILLMPFLKPAAKVNQV